MTIRKKKRLVNCQVIVRWTIFDFFDNFVGVITNLPRNYIRCRNVKLFVPIFGGEGRRETESERKKRNFKRSKFYDEDFALN